MAPKKQGDDRVVFLWEIFKKIDVGAPKPNGPPHATIKKENGEWLCISRCKKGLREESEQFRQGIQFSDFPALQNPTLFNTAHGMLKFRHAYLVVAK